MSKFNYLIITLLRILKYFLSKKKRYSNLLINILKYRPVTILEIGVYNGNRALEMIQAAKIFNKDIEYYGFDLFEDFGENILREEYSKIPKDLNYIKNKLCKIAKINLFKGYTKDTLPEFIKEKKKIDFIFIDGGHSIETIGNDWTYCLKLLKLKSIIIFDDYYLDDNEIVKKYGSNKVFNEINIKKFKKKLLPFTDTFINLQKIQKIKMFKVQSISEHNVDF